MKCMALSAIAVTLTLSDRHGSITSSRIHIPRLCCIHWYDLWRTPSFTEGVINAEDQVVL